MGNSRAVFTSTSLQSWIVGEVAWGPKELSFWHPRLLCGFSLVKEVKTSLWFLVCRYSHRWIAYSNLVFHFPFCCCDTTRWPWVIQGHAFPNGPPWGKSTRTQAGTWRQKPWKNDPCWFPCYIALHPREGPPISVHSQDRPSRDMTMGWSS